MVAFFEYGDSSLNIRVEYYVNVLDWATFLRVKEEINFKIMEVVESYDTDFAFPTRTVYMKNE